MTSIAGDLAGHLNTQIAALTLGTNLFVASEPSTPTDVVTVYDTGGSPIYQDLSGNNFSSRYTIQVRVRNASYTSGYALAESVRGTLRAVVNTTIGSVRYAGIFQFTEITHLGKVSVAGGEAHVWTMNFEVYK